MSAGLFFGCQSNVHISANTEMTDEEEMFVRTLFSLIIATTAFLSE